MNTDESSCSICKKSFNSLSKPKKICRFCGKVICQKCSTIKHQENSSKKRICEKCFQVNLQKSLLSNKSSSFQGFLDVINLKKAEKSSLDLQIAELEKDLSLTKEHISEIRGIHNKELNVIREKRVKLEESLQVLNESLRNIEESEGIMIERIKNLRLKVEEYNEILIQVNQDQSQLDDRIYQTKEMLCKTMNENETLHEVVNQEITEFAIKGKFLQKRIDKFHRKTLGNIESFNSDIAFLTVQVKDLEKKVQEKRIELSLKKDLYQNSHIYLSVDN
jgi:chromosome segregation ATPase